MFKKVLFNSSLIAVIALLAAVCSPSGNEATSVDMDVVANCSGITNVTNDEGWKVKVADFDVALKNFEFTIEGEVHPDKLVQIISDFIVPKAMAHPGHLSGGEVTGELTGNWEVDFTHCSKDKPFGTATLLEGDYHGFNFYFTHGAKDLDSPIAGHTAYITGSASKKDVTVPFEIFVDIEENQQLVGGVFENSQGGGSSNFVVKDGMDAVLGIRLLTLDPYEGDTIFDGIDFSTLKLNDKGVAVVKAGEAASNIISKSIYSHDQWAVTATVKNQ